MWLSNRRDVFISYSSRDRSSAHDLALRLEFGGLTVWLAEWDLLGGDDIVRRIFDGIRDSAVAIVLLSTHSVISNWVHQELDYARVREIDEGGCVVIPLLLGGLPASDIPPALRSKKYIRYDDPDFDRVLFASVRGQFERLLSPVADGSSIAKIFEDDVFLKGAYQSMVTCGWTAGKAFRECWLWPSRALDWRLSQTGMERFYMYDKVCLEDGASVFPPTGGFMVSSRISPVVTRSEAHFAFCSQPGPSEMYPFWYWAITESGAFVYRSTLPEDDAEHCYCHGKLFVDRTEVFLSGVLLLARRLSQGYLRGCPVNLHVHFFGTGGRPVVDPRSSINPQPVGEAREPNCVKSDLAIHSDVAAEPQLVALLDAFWSSLGRGTSYSPFAPVLRRLCERRVAHLMRPWG